MNDQRAREPVEIIRRDIQWGAIPPSAPLQSAHDQTWRPGALRGSSEQPGFPPFPGRIERVRRPAEIHPGNHNWSNWQQQSGRDGDRHRPKAAWSVDRRRNYTPAQM